jgi:hypothetical protein
MKDAIINVLVKGILDSVSLHSHEEETPIDGEQPGPSGINPLSTPEPLSPTNTDSTAPVPEKRKRKQTISKVNGKGKENGRKRQQMIMMKTVPSATKHIHVWREKTRYAAICVPFGTIDSVQT